MRLITTVLLFALSAGVLSDAQSPAAPGTAPTIDDLIALKRAASPVISPDAKWVAYTVRETNWDDNAYETEIWLADARSGRPRQLTNGKKSSSVARVVARWQRGWRSARTARTSGRST